MPLIQVSESVTSVFLRIQKVPLMKKSLSYFPTTFVLLFIALIMGCPTQPEQPPKSDQVSNKEDETPTTVPITPESDTAEPEPVQPDDAESVAKLKEAGAVLQTNQQGNVIVANCKPAQMTDELMPLLKGIPHVEKLDLENGQFGNDALAVLEHLPQLKLVNLRQCSQLDADGLANLKKAPQLERLLLLYTRTNDEGLAHVADLENLVVLDLRGTKIGDEGVNKLTNLPKLVDLKIRSTNVSGESMATIGKMKKLRYLALEDAGVGDDHIGELAALKGLVSFNIMRTYVSDEGLTNFGDQKFKDLRFRDTAIGGPGLVHLKGSIASLTFLDLSETLIDNDGIAHIAPFTNLEHLLVWNGTMDDEGLAPLTELKKLKSLDIHGCRRLTSACADQLVQMENLEEINIAETNFDDDGLEKLAEMKNLKSLSLGQTGVTPDGIAAFKAKQPDCKINE